MDDHAEGEPRLTRRQMRLAEQASAQSLADVVPDVDVPADEGSAAGPPDAPADAPASTPGLEPGLEDTEERPAEPAVPAVPDRPAVPAVPPVVRDEPEVDDVRWDPPASLAQPTQPTQPAQPAQPGWSGVVDGTDDTRPVPRVPPVAPVTPRWTAAPAPPVDPVTVTAAADGHDASGPAPATTDPDLPTLDDLLARRSAPVAGPAQHGWRATVRKVSGGLVRLGPGPSEQRQREAVAAVQRDFGGPRTVVVVNPKGGAHKTTATLLVAATFGMHRGGYTLAWDNNETRGTLGWRSQHGRHQATAVDLLRDLHRFEDPRRARVGDLDAYVRSQTAQFDVLASDEDAASAASIDADAFRAMHTTLSRFYRVMVVDTGNNMRASNWQAAVEAADQVVLVTTVREDTAQSAAWAADALRATGHEDKVRDAVTILADPAVQRDPALSGRLHDHFSRLTRTVVDVPYDPALVAGGPLDVSALHRRTREAWLHVTAAVAEGL